MAISFHTGTTASTGANPVASQAITIPAGVSSGDVIIVVFTAFGAVSQGNETVQVSSTGTAPVLIGTAQNSPTFNLRVMSAAIFSVVAGASDAGKVITATLVSGNTAQWAVALGAWSGASNAAPIDVNGAATAAGNGATITCPTLVTGAANDWALQIASGAVAGATFSGGAGFTQREAIADAFSGALSLIYDSNAPVGGAGTSIGGAVFSNAGQNNWWVGFTVGLAPVPVTVIIPPAGGRSMIKQRLLYADL